MLKELEPKSNAAPAIRSQDYWNRYAGAADRVVRAVPDADHVFQQEGRNLALYHHNGLSALRVIILGLITYDVSEPRAFLDFGCAYGRVLRYFKAAFPSASLTGCDLREDALSYCEETLGATTVVSNSNFAKLSLPRKHDVIWLGSVFTHFDSSASATLLHAMIDNLEIGGVLVFSLHGRVYPQEIQPDRWKILDDAAFTVAKAEYEATGFGYHDYPGRPGVGASLTSPAWVFAQLRDRRDLVFGYQERAWMGWQDIVYVHKPTGRLIDFTSRQDRPY